MAIYRHQVSIARTTALPEDVVVNTFHTNRNATAEAPHLADVEDQLDSFYTSVRPYFGNNVNFADCRLKSYDLADPEPRVPIVDKLMTVGGSNTGDPHPSEVALVVTFLADQVSGVPAGRRRGRIYLGPLDRATAAVGDRDRLDATVQAAISDAAGAMLTGSTFDFDEGFVVYSRVDAAARLIVSGYVDNAWDTQRRRGKAPTNRDTFTPT